MALSVGAPANLPAKLRENTFATNELSAGLAAARAQITAEVASEEDKANVPYNKQVNVEMYSEENRQKRLLLKQDTEVHSVFVVYFSELQYASMNIHCRT